MQRRRIHGMRCTHRSLRQPVCRSFSSLASFTSSVTSPLSLRLPLVCSPFPLVVSGVLKGESERESLCIAAGRKTSPRRSVREENYRKIKGVDTPARRRLPAGSNAETLPLKLPFEGAADRRREGRANPREPQRRGQGDRGGKGSQGGKAATSGLPRLVMVHLIPCNLLLCILVLYLFSCDLLQKDDSKIADMELFSDGGDFSHRSLRQAAKKGAAAMPSTMLYRYRKFKDPPSPSTIFHHLLVERSSHIL